MQKKFELKPLSHEAIPAALERAMRYRLLNEPLQAESVCRDVLEIEPENQEALKILILALTDQFPDQIAKPFAEATRLADQLVSEYEKVYHFGIICERRAHAHRRRASPDSGGIAYHWYHEAMENYEAAEKLRPAGNDESLLRWNSCARVLMRFSNLKPMPQTEAPPIQLE